MMYGAGDGARFHWQLLVDHFFYAQPDLKYPSFTSCITTRVNPERVRDLHTHHGADDGARTRDLRLGKATLYQLSYVRMVSN